MVRARRAPLSSAFVTALLVLAARAASPDSGELDEALARGDERYARRSEGARGPLALPGPVAGAIDDYRSALSLRPGSAEARSRLLRALFFRATFCGSGAEERKRLIEEARRVGDEGVARLDRVIGKKKGAPRAAALREVPGAGELLFWAAAAWGEWALGRSRLAAARAGAPGRIRDLAQAVIDVDPDLEEGGGYRILGRLHDQSPSIPLVSGWVSRETSLACLRKAYAAFPANSVNQLFLAEAILRHEPSRREEAKALLARLASLEPREEYRVEDAHYAALGRDLLSRLR
jgi:hypothetical protein